MWRGSFEEPLQKDCETIRIKLELAEMGDRTTYRTLPSDRTPLKLGITTPLAKGA